MLSRKTLVFLALLLAVLAVAVRFGESHLGDSGGFAQGRLLSDRQARSQSVSFESPGVTNRLVCKENRWVLEPNGRVDVGRMSLAVDSIALARVRDRIRAEDRERRGLSLASYGLENPSTNATFGVGPDAVTVSFGALTPGGDGVFVRLSGDGDVYAIDRTALDQFPASSDELRNHLLFRRSESGFSAFEIRRPGEEPFRLELRADGLWEQVAPFRIPVARSAVGPVVEELAGATALRFAFAPSGETDSADAFAKRRIESHTQADEALLSLSVWNSLGGPSDEFFFSAPSESGEIFVASLSDRTIAAVGRSVLDALLTPPALLREHRLFPMAPESVAEASFLTPRGTVCLIPSEDGEWTLRADGKSAPADTVAATNFIAGLFGIGDLEAEAWDGASMPAEQIRASVVSSFGETTTVCIARAPDGSSAYAAPVPGCGYRRTLEPADVEFLFEPARYASLRSPVLPPFEASSIRTLSRIEPGKPDQILQYGADGWFSERAVRTIHAEAADAIRALLSSPDFRAESVADIFPGSSASYGLIAPAFELSVGFPKPEPDRILQIGIVPAPRKGDPPAAFLRIKGQDAVFRISPAMLSILTAPLTNE